ncbi:hypothetical protein AAHE18_13G333900 [Arachis hypogaea]
MESNPFAPFEVFGLLLLFPYAVQAQLVTFLSATKPQTPSLYLNPNMGYSGVEIPSNVQEILNLILQKWKTKNIIGEWKELIRVVI